MMTKETTTGPGVNGVVEWGYDNNFRVDRLTVNSHATLLTYDDDGLLTGAGAMTLSRGVFNGFLTGTALGSTTDAYTYSPYGETSEYSAKVSGASVFNVLYERDALGRITKKTETISGVTTIYEYGYDQAGRLITVKENGVIVSTYDYDANGNRITAVTKAGTFQGFYDLQDRMTKYGDTTYSYTPNGELLTKTDPSGTTTYNYDVFGNLRSVTMPDGRVIEYVIDAADRRIGKKINGALTQGFIYSGQLEPVAELDGAGNVVSTFVYASKGHVPDYMVKGGVTYRIISDHLGSLRLVLNTSNDSIVQRIDYDEFGNVVADTNPGFQPFGFAGGLYDNDTKLTRFGARNYDPFTGRWTAKDPVGFGGGDMNLYGYVVNNPVQNADPSGLWSKDAHDMLIQAFVNLMPVLNYDLMSKGSQYADSSEYQSLEFAYVHAMSSMAIKSGSKYEACMLANKFVRSYINSYKMFMAVNARDLASFALGMALHTIMDSTSPAHTGFQLWDYSIDVNRHGDLPGSIEDKDALEDDLGLMVRTVALMKRVLNRVLDGGNAFNCDCYKGL